jgi:hypothetical protein
MHPAGLHNRFRDRQEGPVLAPTPSDRAMDGADAGETMEGGTSDDATTCGQSKKG